MSERPALTPELYVSDLPRSRHFYVGVLGCTVAYERPEERFVLLKWGHARLMLQEPVGRVFLAGPREHPYGRGVHLQVEVEDVTSLVERVQAAGLALFLDLEERWYRRDAVEVGNRQFVVADPDGYLLRPFQDLGERPATLPL